MASGAKRASGAMWDIWTGGRKYDIMTALYPPAATGGTTLPKTAGTQQGRAWKDTLEETSDAETSDAKTSDAKTSDAKTSDAETSDAHRARCHPPVRRNDCERG